jgi:Ca2+:H+ antiporter
MFFGGLKRKEQRINVKSASVTSTMLMVAVIGSFTPTVFHKIHGSYTFSCKSCSHVSNYLKSCERCTLLWKDPTTDPVYINSTRPLMYLCCIVLVLTYGLGLLFTLLTHSNTIYPERLREYRKPTMNLFNNSISQNIHQPKKNFHIRSLFDSSSNSGSSDSNSSNQNHGNPKWGIFKSIVILILCSVAYSFIAEILIDTIDSILLIIPISEKNLGLTIFAIVPTITEFCNRFLIKIMQYYSL